MQRDFILLKIKIAHEQYFVYFKKILKWLEHQKIV